MRLSRLFLAWLALSAPAALAAGGDAALPEAFVIGNQVRADMQTLTRLHFELGLDLRVMKTRFAQARLLSSVDAGLARLGRLKLDGKGERLLKRLHAKWADAKPLLAGDYDRKQADYAYALGEELYISSSNLMYHFEDAADSELGKLSDISGRLTSTSERIARAVYHGLATGRAGAQVDYVAWRKEFEEGLALLEASPANDEYQRQNLFLARTMWVLFDSLVDGANRKRIGVRPVDVGKSADGLREIFVQGGLQYEETLRRQLTAKGRATPVAPAAGRTVGVRGG